MQTIFYIIWAVELLAFLSMLAYCRKHRSRAGLVLLVILAAVVLKEGTATFRLGPWAFHPIAVDLIIFIQWAGYLFMFSMVLKKTKQAIAKAVLGAYVLITAAFAWRGLTIGFGHDFIPYLFGATSILTCVLMYFHQEIVQGNTDVPILKRFYPLIFGGLFIWIAVDVPVMTSIDYLVANNLNDELMPFLKVKQYAGIFYYLCYPLALIWSMRN